MSKKCKIIATPNQSELCSTAYKRTKPLKCEAVFAKALGVVRTCNLQKTKVTQKDRTTPLNTAF